ncbi:MAG: hypothetical protein N2Z21_07075 [Candidatus Sumerlaeaceae bacterium]|nr:hypothetical protein [Candidatus Sumerlaeaceae bacterium]
MNRFLSNLLIAVAIIVALGVVAWVRLGGVHRPIIRDTSERVIQKTTVTPSPRLGRTSAKPTETSVSLKAQAPTRDTHIASSPAAPVSGVSLVQSVLVLASLRCPPDAPNCAQQTEARLGLGFVSQDDLREAERGRAEIEAMGRRPPPREELVNVSEWRHINVAEATPGIIRVGPAEMPVADAYSLLAWNTDQRVYYFKRYVRPDEVLTTSSLNFGALDPTPFTGVRLTLRGSAEFASLRAIVHRVPSADSEASSHFLQLAQVIAPELTEALLTAEPIAVTLDQPNTLAPLPPDEAVEITFITPSEIESQPVQVPLIEGKIVDAEVTLDEIFPAGATATIDLQGILEIGDTGKPLAQATVTRDLGGRTEIYTTDERGTFQVYALPMDRITVFDVQTSRGQLRRPAVPERWSFDFSPPLTTTGSVVKARWKIPAYRYVVLDLSSPGARDALALARLPYPIYILEREVGGQWQLQPLDFFDATAEEVAVAVLETGRYRLLLATSPVALWESQPVHVTEKTLEVRTRLANESAAHASVRLRVVDARTREPLVRASVVIGGSHGSLPPLRLLTNDRGELEIPHHRCDSISLWVEKKGYQPVQRTLSSGELNGEVEVILAPEERAR